MWKKFFSKTEQELNTNRTDGSHSIYDGVNKDCLPTHVAIIMDGNGRWAQHKGLMRAAGHKAGVDTLKQILKVAIDLKIKALTVYAFSTENWKRPHAEVDFLMRLFSEYLAKEIDEMDADHVKVRFLGRIGELSSGLQNQVENAQMRTKENTGVRFNIAVNYGGRDELIRAVKIIAEQTAAGKLSVDHIDEAQIEKNLDTAGLPPVDLLIRTSGDMRLSNFLLWQSAYAEFWFTDTNWPDFAPECFVEALTDFQKRDRRFGGLKNK
ncbi:MAG: isoprenyl transferase [Selenomonadaceae bacterium]